MKADREWWLSLSPEEWAHHAPRTKPSPLTVGGRVARRFWLGGPPFPWLPGFEKGTRVRHLIDPEKGCVRRCLGTVVKRSRISDRHVIVSWDDHYDGDGIEMDCLVYDLARVLKEEK